MIKYRTGGTPWIILINPEGRVVYNRFHLDRESLIGYVREKVALRRETEISRQ
jgi:hypothetical protein